VHQLSNNVTSPSEQCAPFEQASSEAPAMVTKESSPGLYLVSFAALYFAANFGLNLVNKTVLAATGMPLFLTFSHMVFSFFVLLPFMLQQSLRAKHAKTLRVHWKGLMAIGCLMALNVSLSNASLVKLSLSLNQVIRRAPRILMPVVFDHSPSCRARDRTGAVIAWSPVTRLRAGLQSGRWEGGITGFPACMAVPGRSGLAVACAHTLRPHVVLACVTHLDAAASACPVQVRGTQLTRRGPARPRKAAQAAHRAPGPGAL